MVARTSFSLMPAFEGKSTGRQNLISHSIGGSFSIREGDWKLCLAAGSGWLERPTRTGGQKAGTTGHATIQLKNGIVPNKRICCKKNKSEFLPYSIYCMNKSRKVGARLETLFQMTALSPFCPRAFRCPKQTGTLQSKIANWTRQQHLHRKAICKRLSNVRRNKRS